uniref:E3 ubiquitin-protein ligase E3D n=1 Tax=Mola mola TaxID=94237 RepID=A0A3Q3X5H5_MOLML
SRKEVSKSPADVAVTGGDCALHIRTPRGELNLALPAGVAFEQGSCIPTPVGDSCTEELHFRLRISVGKSTDEGNVQNDDGTTPRHARPPSFSTEARTQSFAFKRVLPLPNGNWNAIVDVWCCHPDPFANKKLLPRADDCLLGDTFFLVARDSSCDQTLKTCRRLALVSCRSCSSVLGEAVKPVKHSFTLAVSAQGQCAVCGWMFDRSVFLERVVAARLLELSTSLSNFHFAVQTPDGKPFLLIWLLNSDSITASVPETHVGDEGTDGFTDPHGPSLRAARALKLLYTTCSNAGDQQRDWEVNAIGHPVVLPLTVCEELLRVIDKSNSTLPASMRCMRSYEVRLLLCVKAV